MSENFYVVPISQHNDLIAAAYSHRGFDQEECEAAAKFSAYASWHGIRTHNAIKALHLDDHFGSKSEGCVPSARIEKRETQFAASQIWNANKKLGQATAYAAMDEAISMNEPPGFRTA